MSSFTTRFWTEEDKDYFFVNKIMLDALISSKTRVKLLFRLFLNPNSESYLRGMASEFRESTNAVRLELVRFEQAGMIESEFVGNKKLYRANKKFPLYKEVRSILLKQTGLQNIVDQVVSQLGEVKKVYLTGDLAKGKDTDIISLVFVGKPERVFLAELIGKSEFVIDKKIQYLIYDEEEADSLDFSKERFLLLWND